MNTKTIGDDCCMALKLDISKAYDCMDWDYMKEVMNKIGLAELWIKWMAMYVESVNYSVLGNNEVAG